MSKIESVTQGQIYCITSTGECKVTTKGYGDTEYTIVSLDEAGQAMFCAPTWTVEISDDNAILTSTFNRAGNGGGAGASLGGGSGKLKIKVVQSVAAVLADAKKGILYLVPISDGKFDEYIYVIDDEGVGHAERVGSYTLEADVLDLQQRVSALEEHWTLINGKQVFLADNIADSTNKTIYLSSILSN